jgi:hypothetical protein
MLHPVRYNSAKEVLFLSEQGDGYRWEENDVFEELEFS